MSTPVTLLRTGRELVSAVAAIPGLVARIASIVATVEILVRRVDFVTADAARTVEDVGATHVEAAAAVRAAHDLLTWVQPLLDAVTRIDPEASAQVAQLLMRSGPLLDQIDSIMIPLLGELHDAVPDVRDILPVVRRLEPVMVDVETRIAGLPGADRLRRRGAELIERTQSEST